MAFTDEKRGATVFGDLGIAAKVPSDRIATGVTIQPNSLVVMGSGGIAQAGANAANVIGFNREDSFYVQGIDTRPFRLGLGRGAVQVGAAGMTSGQLLKAGNLGSVVPFVDSVAAGGAIGSGAGGGFTNQPSNDSITVVSSAAGDTSQTITFYGTTTGTNTVVSETDTLNGTTNVVTTKTNWGKLLGVSINGTTAGTVTVKKTTGGTTITTLTAGANKTAGIVAVSPAAAAYNAAPTATSNSEASTSQVGLIGADPTGAALLDSVPLNNLAPVQFNSAFQTISSVLVGDVAGTVTATVTVSVIRDPDGLLVGRALETVAAGLAYPNNLGEVLFLPFNADTVAALGKEVAGLASGQRIAAGVFTLTGANPQAIATGLSYVTSAQVTLLSTASPGLDPADFTVDYANALGNNVAAGTVNLYAWKYTSAGNPTLIASTNSTAIVCWLAFGN